MREETGREKVITRRETAVLLGVVLLSLLVRFAYFREYAGRLDALVIADANTHVLLARNLLAKGFYGPQAPWSYRPPLYPLFLAGVFGFFGDRFSAAWVVQALVAALSYLVLYLIARRLFGKTVALLCLVLMAFDFSLIHYCGLFYSETLYILLQAIFLLLLMKGLKSRHATFFLLAGLLLGLSALCRPTILAFIPLLFLVPLVHEKKRDIYFRLLLTVALGLVVVSFWSWRNYRLHGRFVPVSTNAGTMLWMGLHHGASGSYEWPEEGNPLFHVEDEVERSRLGVGESLRFVREYPGEFLLLTGKKFLLFFEFYPHTFSGLQFAFLLVFFVAGLWLSRGRWRALLPLYLLMISFFGVHLLVHSAPRYRLPLVPFFWIFAAYALRRLWHRLRGVTGGGCRVTRQDTGCGMHEYLTQ